MLCSESELNLSNESDGISELSNTKYANKIGKNYFAKSTLKIIDISKFKRTKLSTQKC